MTAGRIKQELHGRVACRGAAQGKVVVIKTYDDLSSVQAGMVLVAAQTDVNYTPYMRQCCAVITEEGGRFCHAAIFARENSVPCITGVNKALETMRNGDFVEVDANNGIIYVLAKSDDERA